MFVCLCFDLIRFYFIEFFFPPCTLVIKHYNTPSSRTFIQVIFYHSQSILILRVNDQPKKHGQKILIDHLRTMLSVILCSCSRLLVAITTNQKSKSWVEFVGCYTPSPPRRRNNNTISDRYIPNRTGVDLTGRLSHLMGNTTDLRNTRNADNEIEIRSRRGSKSNILNSS